MRPFVSLPVLAVIECCMRAAPIPIRFEVASGAARHNAQ